MYDFKVQNKYGDILELTHNPAYVITSIDGINPPDAVINTTRNANADGSVFNSSYIDNRVITVTMAVNSPAEENRIRLYKFFKAKSGCRLFYKNGMRDVYIDGYVQNFTVGYFEKKEVVQIVVVCPNPLFKSTAENITDFSYINDLLEFPFETEEDIPFSEIIQESTATVINHGDLECGAIFTIRASGAVENPEIVNTATNEFFKVNYTLAAGDLLIINTRKKEKSVILRSSGTDTSIIGYMDHGSTWFELMPGDNVFYITADTGEANIYLSVDVLDQFEGV